MINNVAGCDLYYVNIVVFAVHIQYQWVELELWTSFYSLPSSRSALIMFNIINSLFVYVKAYFLNGIRRNLAGNRAHMILF